MPEPRTQTLPGIAEARRILIDASRGFYTQGWMMGTAGNLSIKTRALPELQYVITASGKDKGALTDTDFVRVGAGGQVLEPAGAKSSAETLLHEAVYSLLPEVGAVYHVHTVAATLLSNTTPGHALAFSGLEMIKGLGFDTHETAIELPIVDNTQDIAGLSARAAEFIRADVPGFLVRGHGLYTWGKTSFEARRHVEIWEFLFRYRLAECRLG